jgi:hypothetical protein
MRSDPFDPWYSRTMARMSAYWDDEWARAYLVSQSGAWRSTLRRAKQDPFVFKPNHGPDAVQTSEPGLSARERRRLAFLDLPGEDKLVLYLRRREELANPTHPSARS